MWEGERETEGNRGKEGADGERKGKMEGGGGLFGAREETSKRERAREGSRDKYSQSKMMHSIASILMNSFTLYRKCTLTISEKENGSCICTSVCIGREI